VTGLIIGKFMPLHQGHIDLINFAQSQCDKTIIHLAVKPDEPIPGNIRLKWLEETFSMNKNIIIHKHDNFLPDAPYSSKEVSQAWAQYLLKLYPETDYIFSSEKYGDYLAEYMNKKSSCYDPQRKKTAVSGTDIRNTPFKYWDHIPEAVRPWYVKKVCIYGPESTGKSTLTKELAYYYSTEYVSEVARDILGDRHVIYEDIPFIAKAHAEGILKKEKTANKILFCDTDIITTKIYSKHYFNKVPDFDQWIYEANTFDHYLFCDIDVPWVEDPQRDAGHLREKFRAWFINELDTRNINYTIIEGDWESRFKKAVTQIQNIWDDLNVKN